MCCFCGSVLCSSRINRSFICVGGQVSVHDFLEAKGCSICGKKIEDNTIYFKHPKHGIVCQNCPEFADGGIMPMFDNEENLKTMDFSEANIFIDKCLAYESFIQEITKQIVHHRDGDKPTKLAVRAKELLERYK